MISRRLLLITSVVVFLACVGIALAVPTCWGIHCCLIQYAVEKTPGYPGDVCDWFPLEEFPCDEDSPEPVCTGGGTTSWEPCSCTFKAPGYGYTYYCDKLTVTKPVRCYYWACMGESEEDCDCKVAYGGYAGTAQVDDCGEAVPCNVP